VTPALTPDEIYVAAVAAVRALAPPPYVTYRVDFRGRGATLRCVDGLATAAFEGRDAAGSFRVSFRTRDRAATTTDLATQRVCAGTPLIAPEGGDIGGLVEPAGRAAPAPAASDDSGKNSVSVVGALHYRVLSAQLEPFGDAEAYHVTVRALADPALYPLTDLWIEPGTFAIRRVRGTFSDTYAGVPATIVGTGDFERIGSAWLLVREHVDFAAATSPRPTRATLDATAAGFAFPSSPPPGLP
jgi:hypothetical protein